MCASRIVLGLVGFVAVAGLLVIGCDEDPAYKPTPPGQTSNYKNLQSKDDVLFNLDLAYNERNFEEFAKLLDDDFIFVLSTADYNSGQVDVPQWDRTRELSANEQILDPNLDGGKRVISIYLSLDYTGGDWTPEPPDTVHPEETWYVKVVDYDLVTKTADDWEHRALDLKALFKIREDESTGRWRIVEWRDDVDGLRSLSSHGRIVEETTWGSIKAQYN